MRTLRIEHPLAVWRRIDDITVGVIGVVYYRCYKLKYASYHTFNAIPMPEVRRG